MGTGKWFCLVAILTSVLIGLSAPGAGAQGNSQRRDELKLVPELIAGEPDPITRIANFEGIVAEGDQLKTELAIRSAMGVDDAQLHSVAMKAYLATVQEVTFTWILPEAIAAKLENEEALSSNENNFYKLYLSKGGLIAVKFSEFEKDGSFQVDEYGQILEDTRGRSLGDRVLFRAKVRMGGIAFCNFEFAPTADLKLDGTMACEDTFWGAPTRITADMF